MRFKLSQMLLAPVACSIALTSDFISVAAIFILMPVAILVAAFGSRQKGMSLDVASNDLFCGLVWFWIMLMVFATVIVWLRVIFGW